MSDQERKNTIRNIIGAMSGISGSKREEIILRQVNHFYKADKELALKVAQGLGINFQVN
jgi:catalase